MSKHLFKIPLLHSDMFVEAIDVVGKTITYELRQKEEGGLLEPKKTSPYTEYNNQLHFDMRFIDLTVAQKILQTLS